MEKRNIILSYLLNQIYYILYKDMLNGKIPEPIFERFKDVIWDIQSTYKIDSTDGSLDN